MYEFLDEEGRLRSRGSPPEACTVAGHSKDARGLPIGATIETFRRNDSYRIIHNLWFSKGSFYKIVDEGHPEVASPKGLSSNINLYTLAVNDVESFIANTKKALYVQGETVLIDYSYFIHPTAIGHWLEYLLPMMSARRLEGFTAPPAMVVIMHLKRSFVFEWVRAALGAALGGISGVRSGENAVSAARQEKARRWLPFPIIFQEETQSVWDQIGTTLEGISRDEWVCFEKVIVAKDVIDDGPRTAFMDVGGEQDARGFRDAMYRAYGVDPSGKANDRNGRMRITLLHKSSNRRILNRDELKVLLGTYGSVREVELTDGVSMATQIGIMSNTDVLVSTHTSGLANAMFLRPGALVVELRHRNFLEAMEQTFELQIKSLKDVRWVSWRAMDIVYLNKDDERKFKGWENCDIAECVEAHTLVDLLVNVTAVGALLAKAINTTV